MWLGGGGGKLDVDVDASVRVSVCCSDCTEPGGGANSRDEGPCGCGGAEGAPPSLELARHSSEPPA